jgi:hypothetical protein
MWTCSFPISVYNISANLCQFCDVISISGYRYYVFDFKIWEHFYKFKSNLMLMPAMLIETFFSVDDV